MSVSSRMLGPVLVAPFMCLCAFAQTNSHQMHSRYRVVDTRTLGGPNSGFQVVTVFLNGRGSAIPNADTHEPDPNSPCFNPDDPALGTDCFVRHAGMWKDQTLTDLGTLPGAFFSQGLWISPNGLIAGASDTGTPDPLTGQPLQSRAVFWRKGIIQDLGTFGGNESVAISVNSRGQVAGAALNETSDPFAGPFAGFTEAFAAATQCRAFVWENGTKQDLGTLGGPDAFGVYINESGQVTGYSYVDSTPDPVMGIPPIHPFLWDRGRMIDLGTLGGVFSLPLSLDNRGQVVGFMNLPGDRISHPFLSDVHGPIDLGTLGGDGGQANWINEDGVVVGAADLPGSTVHHAFLWKNGRIHDLGVPAGLPCSTAAFINAREQVVGDAGECNVGGHGWLWENGGPPVELTLLIPADANVHITDARNINDAGEIAAIATLPNGDQHAVLLIPIQGNDCCEGHELEGAAPDDLRHFATPGTYSGSEARMRRLHERIFRQSEQHHTPQR